MSHTKINGINTMNVYNNRLQEKEKENTKTSKQRNVNKLRQLDDEQEHPPPGNGRDRGAGQKPTTKSDQYLVPGGMGWGLRNREDSRPHHIFQNKEQAIQYAQNKAENQKSLIIILEKNGEIKKKPISTTTVSKVK